MYIELQCGRDCGNVFGRGFRFLGTKCISDRNLDGARSTYITPTYRIQQIGAMTAHRLPR